MKVYKLYRAGDKYLIVTGRRRNVGQVVALNGKYHARIRTAGDAVTAIGATLEAAFDAVVDKRLNQQARKAG